MHRGKKKELSIHLTDLCNSACIFCVVGIPQKTHHLGRHEEERIRRAIVDGAGQGYEVVNIHGGEPTVAPGFLETLELIRRCGYPRVHLQTNGRRLKDANFVRRLRELNVELFLVSMHGRTAETHDWLTGHPGGFEETVCGIRNVKSAGGLLETNTVVTKQNLTELPEMVDWLVDLEVGHINLSNPHPAETAYVNFDLVTPTVCEVRQWVPAAVERATARGVPLTLEGFPFCALPGCEGYHLRRMDGAISIEIRGMWIENYEQWMDQYQRIKGKQCEGCAQADSCGGVYRAYIDKRGWSEFQPRGLPVAVSS